MRLRWVRPRVRVTGNKATISVEAHLLSKGGGEKVGEIYQLEKTGIGWRVVRNRWWMKEKNSGKGWVRYTSDEWKKLDVVVEEERSRGKSLELAQALKAAFRVKEAWILLRDLCGDNRVDAEIWLERGMVAMRVGDVKDALRSLREARRIDPDVWIPDYAK